MTPRNIERRRHISRSVAIAAVALVTTNAAAQEFVSRGPQPDDPIMQLAEQLAPRNQFFIDSNQNVEVIRFKTARDVEICADRARHDVGSASRGYPIKVNWDDQNAIIAPGNCMAFDSQRVSVSAASRLPQDVVLTGSFRVRK